MFAVYHLSDGRLASVSSIPVLKPAVLGDPILDEQGNPVLDGEGQPTYEILEPAVTVETLAARGFGVVEVDPMPPRATWDTALRTFVSAPLQSRTRLTSEELTRRFTVTERTALKIAKMTHANMTVRARIEILEEDIILADRLDMTDPHIVAGITYAVDALVQLGTLTAQERDGRLAELLAFGEAE